MVLLLAAVSVTAQSKKNTRPDVDPAGVPGVPVSAYEPVYSYEFSKPDFVIARILIEHDEQGVGRIVFMKKDFEEEITEPLSLSAQTLEKVRTLWQETGFLETDEKFQSPERDYAHLGTVRLRMKREGLEKTQELNWTEMSKVRELIDEYRRIGNQFVWMFDMNVSRQNQPLESTRIMQRFDSYLRRGEIADPKQTLPFLKGIAEDERFPLITRNHAQRLIKKIEKK